MVRMGKVKLFAQHLPGDLAVRRQRVGMQKRVEEIGITALFVATLGVWVRDESPGAERTRRFLANRLAAAERAMAWLRR